MGGPRKTLRQHIERKLGKRVMEGAGATRVLASDGIEALALRTARIALGANEGRE
jgi:hypothetical protein